ncbi:hypothetical protein [Sphingopyxis sp. C-1]|uniref:hypothetical protein n=1 Tax=Sphingopyxis sp. C-1 TaxID=262667 RepID=UPI0006BF5914|nr:hypothetical protein [Sphingopyxis sp. C-1]GAO77462.1 hypothetical protein SC1_00753 [Sphingopyxis sp. C-1]
MMNILLVAMLAAASAGSDAPRADVRPASLAAAKVTLSIDTPIETLMANPKARAILDQELPKLDQHPAYSQFKTMSLAKLQPLSAGQISDAQLAAIKAKLAKL